MITSFQAQGSQNGTPGTTPSSAFASHRPPAERALLDDGPVHPEEPESRTKDRRDITSEVDPGNENCDPMTKGKQGKTMNGQGEKTAQKERNPKPVVSSDYKRKFDREQASSADKKFQVKHELRTRRH